MNELEISTWSLWADTLNWPTDNLTLDDFIMVTAIQVKKFLNNEKEMDTYSKKITADYPNVKTEYDQWIKSHPMSLSIVDINKRYRKFRQVHFKHHTAVIYQK